MPEHPAIYALLALAACSLYGYNGLKRLFAKRSLRPGKRLAILAFWLLDAFFISFSLFWLWYIRGKDIPDFILYRLHYYLVGAYMLVILPKLLFALFVLIHDLKNLLADIFIRLYASVPAPAKAFHGLLRTKKVLVAGVLAALLIFFWTLYGLTFGRHKFQVETVALYFEDLPSSFDEYQIVHFSDTHLGSFSRKCPVVRGLEMISRLEADVVFFTGDLINNHPDEAAPFVLYFRAIQPPDGKFAVLGNHDLGDYRTWSTIENAEAEVYKVEDVYQKMGFKLLRNEHVFLQRANDSIMLAGVDNWGLDPFTQHGDLEKALGDHAGYPFQIMLSHDPSHWREEIIPKTQVELTLSGHTHAMQMGIQTPLFSWSPSAWIYSEWAGVYREQDQKIYVNRGFGFLSLPGRIGMPPEITKIILRRKHHDK